MRKERFASLLAVASRWMTAEKRLRLSRTLLPAHRDRMLYGELLLHYTLAEKFGLSAEERRIAYGSKGKPVLAAAALPPVHFNLSHSGGWIACAFDRHPVGIDVETVRRDSGKLAPLFLTPDEYYEFARLACKGEAAAEAASSGELTEALSSERACEFITRRWTLKESIVKADGAGLSQPLYKLEPIRLHDGSWSARLGRRNYRISQYRLDNNCWMSVCRSVAPVHSLGEADSMPPAFPERQASESGCVPEQLGLDTLVKWTMSQL